MLVSLFMTVLSAVLPACEHEDSMDCYWNASERGNGIGNDVAIVTISPDYALWFVVRPDGVSYITVNPSN